MFTAFQASVGFIFDSSQSSFLIFSLHAFQVLPIIKSFIKRNYFYLNHIFYFIFYFSNALVFDNYLNIH